MKESESMTKIVRSLRSGQITIPADFRRQLGIRDDSVLQMTLTKGELHIKPLQIEQTGEGSPWLRTLYDQFAPVREEALAKGFSEEEINQLIDEAVTEVRKKHA